MKKAIIAGLALVTLTAASDEDLNRQKYQVPAGTTQTANVFFPKGNLHLTIYGDGDAQYYGIKEGPACKNSKRLIMYNPGIGNNTKEKIITIEAGRKLSFIATTLKKSSSGYGTAYGIGWSDRWHTCTRVFSFTPKPGASYLISQEALSSRADFCSVSVKEEATGERPQDVVEAPPLACIF